MLCVDQHSTINKSVLIIHCFTDSTRIKKNKLVSFYDASFDENDFNNTMLASKTQPGLMSSDDKVKLDSLSSGGSTSPNPVNAKDILVDSEHCFVTDKQKASWSAKPETKEDIGLSNVTNDAQVKRSELGVAGGVPTLDESGLIPSAFLPGFVDDVVEADSVNSFPTQGESGKLYVSTTENKTYRWSGSSYIEITSGLALGETSATAYAGDKGKAVSDAVDAITNGTTVVPKATDASTVSGFTVAKAVPEDAVFTDTVYVHPESHPATMIVQDDAHKFATSEELAKVDAIPEDPKYTDTVYVHPETHPATMITEDENHKFATAEELAKVDAIPEDPKYTDTVYVHPESHPAAMITEDDTHKFVSTEQISKWDGKANEIHRTPYYDSFNNCVFACGVGITVDATSESNKLKVTWEDESGTKSLEVPELVSIVGGGYGETEAVHYPGASITINGGRINSVFGGNLNNGTVGDVVIVMNGGDITSGLMGGGCAFNNATKKSSMNTVAHATIIVNNSNSHIFTLYGGGQGLSTVGHAEIIINDGSADYVTAGGSNGHTSIGEITVNGGTIKVLQGCNRGSMANIKLNINGGTIDKVYAGGETEDKGVTATYIKSEVYVSGGNITHIYDGTNGGVEDSSKISGTYKNGVVSDEEAAKLHIVKEPEYALSLEGKTLVLKLGDKVVSTIDLTSINA